MTRGIMRASNIKPGDSVFIGARWQEVSSVGDNSLGRVLLRFDDDTTTISIHPDEFYRVCRK